MNRAKNNEPPIIVFENVAKAFGETVILDGVSFEVYHGETFCLIGGSGTGKSVSLKLLLGLMPLDGGEIYYKGNALSSMSQKELRLMRYDLGMVFQGSALFDSLTVAENIAYPLIEQKRIRDEGEAGDIIKERLDWVGLPGIEDYFPSDLSGGMRKRVGLARALASDPDLILYDEPTAGLDPSNVNRIDTLIQNLQKKLSVTSIVVTHHMDSVFAIADHVALLYDKKIQFQGTVDELRNSSSPLVQGFISGKLGA